MGDVCSNARSEIEGDIFFASKLIFYSLTENPEEVHVTNKMHPSSMQKYTGEEREESGPFIRNESPLHEGNVSPLCSYEKNEKEKQGIQSN